MRIAKLCKKQGQFALACQKYTQYGKKAKAIKCLIKQGNIKVITSYANTARSPECYIIAANYMQNTNWHSNPEVMKTIVSFYNKAKAYENLSAFYEACAQMEIDEYREYDKAFGAMAEAVNAMKKIPNSANTSQKLQLLEHRMKLISDFVKARTLAESNPGEMVKMCSFIIDCPDAETALRVGDVMAHLIEFYYKSKDYKSAYEYLQKMYAKKIRVNPYLDQEIINNIHVALGLAVPGSAGTQEGISEEIKEEIDEA